MLGYAERSAHEYICVEHDLLYQMVYRDDDISRVYVVLRVSSRKKLQKTVFLADESFR